MTSPMGPGAAALLDRDRALRRAVDADAARMHERLPGAGPRGVRGLQLELLRCGRETPHGAVLWGSPTERWRWLDALPSGSA